MLPGAVSNGTAAILKAVVAKGKWKPESLSNALAAAEAAHRAEAVEVLKAAGAVSKPAVTVDAAVLATYAGSCKGPSGPMNVELADGKLTVTTQGPKLVLRALSESQVHSSL